ncbi:MAG: GNAT family N-acetyltransferase [Halanaeroarchaeum sp.]
MSIDVRPLDDAARWNELLTDADHPTAFHHAGALDVLERHSGTTCHRLVGFKGEEPIGLFPVFTLQKGPATVAFSPPPNLKLPYLGPRLLERQPLKRRRRDRRNRRFVDACLDWLDAERATNYTSIRTAPAYDDVRPFLWQGYGSTLRYTYIVDLDRSADDLLTAFSTDARKNVTKEYDVDYEIGEGERDDIERIVDQVTDRHAEQGESFALSSDVIHDLYEELPEGVVRPYVCRIEGEFTGGFVNLEFGDRAICWIGAAKVAADLPVNDLLDWGYAKAAMGRGVVTYDLAGANNPRIAGFKAKFAPDLVPYYALENGGRTMTALSKLYGTLNH